MARFTLGDQVTISTGGEKGTIVGESNGLYDVRIGTSETRRGLRARDLKRFVPESSSPLGSSFMMDIPGVTGVPIGPGGYDSFMAQLRASGAKVTTAGGETKEGQAAFAAEVQASVAEMERNPDSARARQNRAMADQLASSSMLDPAEADAACRAQQEKLTERRAKGKTSHYILCNGPAVASCGRCKSVKYCSRNCQKLNWSRHKPACAAARKIEGGLKSRTGKSGDSARCGDAERRRLAHYLRGAATFDFREVDDSRASAGGRARVSVWTDLLALFGGRAGGVVAIFLTHNTRSALGS